MFSEMGVTDVGGALADYPAVSLDLCIYTRAEKSEFWKSV